MRAVLELVVAMMAAGAALARRRFASFFLFFLPARQLSLPSFESSKFTCKGSEAEFETPNLLFD